MRTVSAALLQIDIPTSPRIHAEQRSSDPQIRCCGSTMIRLVVLFFAVVSSEPQGYELLGGYDAEPASEGRDQSPIFGEDASIDAEDQTRSLRGRGLLDPEVDDQLEGNGWLDTIPGTAGKDYPNHERIPETSFSCEAKTPGGYYADIETRCQVFHVCNTGGQKDSFLCPNGSIFNQKYFVCDWWYDFECDDATDLYSLNDEINRGGIGSGPGGPGRVGPNDYEEDDYSSEADGYPGTRYRDGGNSVGDGYDLSLAGTGEGGAGYARNGESRGYQSNVENDSERQQSGNKHRSDETPRNQGPTNQRSRASKGRLRSGNGNDQSSSGRQGTDYLPANEGKLGSGSGKSNAKDDRNSNFNHSSNDENGDRRRGENREPSEYLPPKNRPRGFSSNHDQSGGSGGGRSSDANSRSGNADGASRGENSSPSRPSNRYLSPEQSGNSDDRDGGQRSNDQNSHSSANGNGRESSISRQPNINGNGENGYTNAQDGPRNGQGGHPGRVKGNGYPNVRNSVEATQNRNGGSYGERSSSGPRNSYLSPRLVGLRESDGQTVNPPNDHSRGITSSSRDGYSIESPRDDINKKGQNVSPSQTEPTGRITDDGLPLPHGGDSPAGPQRKTGGLKGGIGNGYPSPGPNRALPGSGAIAGTLAAGLSAGGQNSFLTNGPSSDTERSLQTGVEFRKSNGNGDANSGFQSDRSRVQSQSPRNGYPDIRPNPNTNGHLGGQGTTSLATKVPSGTRAPGEITSISTGQSSFGRSDDHREFKQQQGYENGEDNFPFGNDPFGGRINERKGLATSQQYLPSLSSDDLATVRNRQENRDNLQSNHQSSSQQSNHQVLENQNGRAGSGGAGNISFPPTGPGVGNGYISNTGGRIESIPQERRFLPAL